MAAVLRRFGPLLVPLVVLLAYVQTLEAPFVWDDRHVIVESPRVQQLRPLAEYLGRAFWVSPESGDVRAYFRPLTVLSFALDHRIHGPNPAGFHLTNVLLHSLNALLAYLLLRRFRTRAALAACLVWLWALHPRLTEAVAWVSGRTDVLATTFVLLAVLLYRPRSLPRLLLACALVVAGMLSKEVALVGLAALAMLALQPGVSRSAGSTWTRDAAPRVFILVLALALYLALRAHALGGVAGSALEVPLGGWHRVMLALAAIGHYVRMVVWPWFPELQIGDVLLPEPGYALAGVAALAAIGALTYRLRSRCKAGAEPPRALVSTGASLVVVGFALVLHLMPISVGVVAADRFLYVPLLGASMLLAACLRAWRPARAGGAALALLLGSFLVATVVRGRVWGDELELWRQAYHSTPKGNVLPGNELGNVYFRAGLYEEAAALFAHTAERGRHSSTAGGNLGSALSQLGLYAPAQRHLQTLCVAHQRIAKFCLDAALVELHLLNFDSATTLARVALARAGEYPDADAVLALIPRVRALAASPELRSADPAVGRLAAFRLAYLAGRRPEALELGRQLLREPGAPRDARRQAAEYWTRFGPPEQLGEVLGSNGGSTDVVDDALLDVAAMRLRTAERLRAVWITLGIPKYESR